MKTTPSNQASRLDNVILALFIALPSLTFVGKRLGLVAALVHVLLIAILLPLVIEKWFSNRAGQVPWKRMVALVIAGVFLLSVAFEFAYPIANSGRFGPGSDRDEALNQAVAALLKGEYPYYQKTYLGNPISPMPGSLVLAAPFYWLFGNGAYQTVFWVGVFALVLIQRRSAESFPRLMVFGLSWLVSPALAQEFLTGGDLIANSLFMAVATYWVIEGLSSPVRRGGEMLMAAVLLGICLSSRANFMTIVPIVFFVASRVRGHVFAITHGLVAAAAFVALTGAFYLHDPGAFSPLHTANKLARFNGLLPNAVVVVPLVTMLVSCLLGLFGNLRHVYTHIAVVLALPVVASVLLQSLQMSQLNFDSADFALPALIFAVLGWRARCQGPAAGVGAGA